MNMDSYEYTKGRGGYRQNYNTDGGRNFGGRGRGRGNYNNRGGYTRTDEDPDRQEKRRKFDEPMVTLSPFQEVELRLKTLIIRIGDGKSASLEDNLDGLASALNEDIVKYKTIILETLYQCALHLPIKSNVYASLVGLLSQKSPDVGKEITATIKEMMQDALDKLRFEELKPLVQFVVSLANANVVSPVSVVDLLNLFLAASEDYSSNSKRSDYFVFLALQTFPWVGKLLSEKLPEEFAKIWDLVDGYVQKRPAKPNPLLHVFEVDAREDQLSLFWKNVKDMKKSDWKTDFILAPHIGLKKQLGSSAPFEITGIVLPGTEVEFPFLKPIFRIFDENDTERELKPIERLIVEEYLIDLIYHFNANHKEAIKQILALPFDVTLDYLIVETIFSELLRLPNPQFKEVYFACLIMDLCKVQPTVAPALGKAIFLLFERTEKMDMECIDRFSSWFSHHLSNFDYRWDWTIWDYLLTAKEDNPKIYFIREVLEKCVRLSYFERVQKTLPEEFHSFLQDKPDPHFKYDSAEYNTNKPYAAKVNILLEHFRTKTPSEAIISVLNGDEFADFSNEEKTQLVAYAVLKNGSKSFSHFLATAERYLSLLQHFTATSETQMILLKEVYDFWRLSPQNLILQVDRLMTYRVIDNITIVRWVFSCEAAFTRGYIWEILRNTINKTLARTVTIEEELRNAEAVLAKSDDKSEDSMEGQRVKDRRAALVESQQELRGLFSSIFKGFVSTLGQRLAENETKGNNFDFFTFITQGNLKTVGRKYHKVIRPFLSSFDNLFIGSHPKIAAIFANIKNL